MFNYFYGRCLECPPSETKLIVVKRQLCKYHNELLKRSKKVNVKKAIKQLNESLPRLKKKLDDVFSLYIRQKHADENGLAKCYTCGKIAHWKKQQCGHYVSRRHLSTRFDVMNCRPQCFSCNIKNQGAADTFAQRLKEEYGDSILTLLNIRKHNKCVMGRFEYELLIKEFTQKLDKLNYLKLNSR